MADERIGLRPRASPTPRFSARCITPAPETSLKPLLTNSDKCRQYREKIKQDAERYKVHKKNEAARKRADRSNRTEEQKLRDRENSRKRSQAYRDRKKSGVESLKRMTRYDCQKLDEKREEARLRQQKRRTQMSHQKRTAERTKNREYMRQKRKEQRADKLANATPPASLNPISRALFTTPGARRTASYRARRNISLGGIVGAVRSVFKKNPESIQQFGVTYTSPKKMTQSSPASSKLPWESRALLSLRKKRDLLTLRAKNLLSATGHGLDEENIQHSPSALGRLYLKRNKHIKELYAKRNSQIKITVTSFYREHSLHLPGKDSVGKKILDQPIAELYALFRTRNPNVKISQSHFFRLRPKTVLSYMKTPMRQCLCETCQNPRLKLSILNGFPDLTSLVEATMCGKGDDSPFHRLDCIKRECSFCKNKLDFMFDSEEFEKEVEWKRWEPVKKDNGSRLDLVRKSGSLLSMIDELKGELRHLPDHIFTYRWQRQQYSMLIDNLPSGWAVATMDFAENYVCFQQDQPQSAYYSYSQVTLHPVVINYLCCHCNLRVNDSITFISDCLKHDYHFVQVVQNHVEQYLSAVTKTTKLVVFSDGCAGQYKSKVPFCYLSQQDTSFVEDIERCFFGARHGKNPCDALCGVIKSAVSRAVRARQIVVQNAQDFFHYCSKNLVLGGQGECCHSKRSFTLITQDQILAKFSSLELKTVPGTRKLHSLRPLGNDILATRQLSCFCAGCQAGDYANCENRDYVSPWQQIKFAPKKPLISEESEMNNSSTSRTDYFSSVHQLFRQCNTFTELVDCCRGLESQFRSWPIPVKYHTVLSVGGTVDSDALKLKPSGLDTLYPVIIEGDGNCMPRALSLAIFGSQQFHEEIRCRITCMLALRFQRYNALLGPDMMKVAELSSCRFDSNFHEVGEVQRVYEREVLHTVNNSTDMSLWHLMAAADALDIPIMSVYPRKGPQCNQKLLDRTLYPPKPGRNQQSIVVMWTSCGNIPMLDEYWVANHISLLLPLSQPFLIDV